PRGREARREPSGERGRIDADVAEIHRPDVSAWTSSNITPPSTGFVSAPRPLACPFLGGRELTTALSNLGDRAIDVWRAKTDPLQMLLGRRKARGVLGLDQLEIELAARASQQQALRHDAEAHAVGQRR